MSKKTDYVQRSITIPKDIDKKLDYLLSATSAPSNKSALISKILKFFFDNEEYMKKTIYFDSDIMLVPLQLYKDVENISQIAVDSRLKKGEIKIEKIGSNDFVVVDKNSIKNIYLQNAQLQNTVKEFGLTIIHFKNLLEEIQKEVADIKKEREI